MANTIQILIAVLTFHVVSGSVFALDTEQLAARLEAEVPGLMNEGHVPDLSMVLIRENRIVWKGCFGVRVAGEPAKVDHETVFEAASMSKPLFSYAVLKLVENAAFDLDRPLDSYLPEPYLPDQPLAKEISLYTTPTDYARFLMAVMQQDRSAQHSLNAEMIQAMTTLQVEPEADSPRSRRSLGWAADTQANGD